MDGDREVKPDPLALVGQWVDAARTAGDAMPDAMCVATASADGEPSARMVLLRGLDHGLVFFTDYESHKGADLGANPRASAVLHLLRPQHRQVRVGGHVERTSAEESDRYWRSRPVAARRSAIASHQSAVIASREELERRVQALADDPDPSRPGRWGGFRILPHVVEFWQEGADRLHDRVRYRAVGPTWTSERLSP